MIPGEVEWCDQAIVPVPIHDLRYARSLGARAGLESRNKGAKRLGQRFRPKGWLARQRDPACLSIALITAVTRQW